MNSAYKKCLAYIKKNQKALTFHLPEDAYVHIGLPNPFVAPSSSEGIFENDQFYWDSYFIILGLVQTNHIALAKGMVENCVYLFNKLGLIPSRNRYYSVGISQPPFFTSMILEVYNNMSDTKWLLDMASVAEKELNTYWMDNKKVHKVYKGLSRYCGSLRTHVHAEYESGWDVTSRFDDRCMDVLPIDLNCLLYKYETDLSLIYEKCGDTKKAATYAQNARKRKETINTLMWNQKKGFFFDYDYKQKTQNDFLSLAGFYPLWCGLTTKEQAEDVARNLSLFEYEGGLANTQKEELSTPFRQWDCPNGWPNQQWIVIKGLLDYGFKKEATRLAQKWLDMNVNVFEKTGVLWEKYNVVTADKGKDGRYPTQKGFGWTNAVFIKLLHEMEKL